LLGRLSRVLSGGKEEGRSGARSWKILSGRKRSLRRLSPRSLKVAPAGSWSRTISWVGSESKICPPWAADSSLATLFTGGPK
jgi:hypothetical protein